jgi:AcrR family transcriptional regulator
LNNKERYDKDMPLETYFNLTEEKKQRILNGAIKEFAKNSFFKTSMQSIAKRAGISKGSMYQYFEGKKELYVYLFKYALEKKFSYFEHLIKYSETRSFYAIFEEMLYLGTKFGLDHPDLFELSNSLNELYTSSNKMAIEIVSEINNIVNIEGVKLYSQFVYKAIDRAFINGEIRSDIDKQLIYFFIDRVIQTFGQYMLEKVFYINEEDIRRHVKQVISILKEGIEPKNNNS